jgi:D-cysteine desulfhydrase
LLPLFEQYPLLKDQLPYISLGDFPTPVQRLEKLGTHLGFENLYIKRDDISAKKYGGNKVRKLEFLLGKSLQDGVKEVMTFGAAGSNHAAATAFYANYLGMRCVSILISQVNAYYIRKNLKIAFASQAELHHYGNLITIALGVVYQLIRHRIKSGKFSQVIPPGGSSPLGSTGFVNAAFELKQQVVENVCPEPDWIYVPCGSMGLSVGLVLGLKAAGLRSKVVPINVGEVSKFAERRFVRLFYRTNDLLSSLDPSFPRCELRAEDVGIRNEFGHKYAQFTEAGVEAVSLMMTHEGLLLEGTYTGKAFAAVLEDIRKGIAKGRILFWHTYNSRDFTKFIGGLDYKDLPGGFHPYFEKEVQPLDKISL